MKIEIKITKIGTGFLETDEEIVNICVCNGNWKYWDDYFEGYEKESLTINTINKAHYLSLPVNDAYPIHNREEALQGNLIIEQAIVRPYNNLLEYLNCRIENTKEEYCKHGWTERTYHIVMLEGDSDRNDVTAERLYDKVNELELNFRVIE